MPERLSQTIRDWTIGQASLILCSLAGKLSQKGKMGAVL
jgi:hypothetical protein